MSVFCKPGPWCNDVEVVSALRRSDTVLQNRFLLLRVSSSKAHWSTMPLLLPHLSPCMPFFKLLYHSDGIHYENFTEAKQMQVPCPYGKLKLHNPFFFPNYSALSIATVRAKVMFLALITMPKRAMKQKFLQPISSLPKDRYSLKCRCYCL